MDRVATLYRDPKTIEFNCPECHRPGTITLWNNQPAEWECGEEFSLCHRLLLIHPDGTVEVVGHWEVIHVYD